MFVTYVQAEVPLGLMANKPEIRHWRYAELSICCIWLYVSFSYIRSGHQRQCTLLMPELREFEQLLNDQGDTLWIEDVMVVSPGDVNGSGAWMMERLGVLVEAINPNNGGFVYIYVLENGRRYTEAEMIQSDKLRDERIIYQSSNHFYRHKT